MSGPLERCVFCRRWHRLVANAQGEFTAALHDCPPSWIALDEWGDPLVNGTGWNERFYGDTACEAAERAAAWLARRGLASGDVVVRVRPYGELSPWIPVLVRVEVVVYELPCPGLFDNFVEDVEFEVGAVGVIPPQRRRRSKPRRAA